MKLHQLIVGANSRRVRKASQAGGPSDEREEADVQAVEYEPVRTQQQDPEAPPRWRKRGLFAVGGVLGAPRVGSARKFTK